MLNPIISGYSWGKGRPNLQIVNPKAIGAFVLKDAFCYCGHTDLEHRIDRTCAKCLCISLRERVDA